MTSSQRNASHLEEAIMSFKYKYCLFTMTDGEVSNIEAIIT